MKCRGYLALSPRRLWVGVERSRRDLFQIIILCFACKGREKHETCFEHKKSLKLFRKIYPQNAIQVLSSVFRACMCCFWNVLPTSEKISRPLFNTSLLNYFSEFSPIVDVNNVCQKFCISIYPGFVNIS